MKKGHITFLSILLVIILFVSGGFLLNGKSNDQSKEGDKQAVLEENQDKTITHDNGDFVYAPANEEIGYDSEAGIIFYENLLNIFLVSEISNEQAEELAHVVSGNVVGKLQGSINMLQIQVEEKSLSGLHKLADRLMNEDLITFVGSSSPSFIADLHTDHVSSASEKVDQLNPDGNNWWAEAIYAYSAWEYMDEHKDEFEKVTVNVLENGKLGKKDDAIDDHSIDKDTVTVNKSSSKEAIYETMGKSNLSHAELVTKIIAADENSQTIRGVAKPNVKIEFSSIGSSASREMIRENLEHYNQRNMGEAEMIAGIKSSDQSNDVTIINNSWGFPPISEKKWNNENWFKSLFQDATYDEYLNAHRKLNDKISVQLIIALDLFLKSEKNNEFLIVQSAGNGYSHTDGEDWDKDTSTNAQDTGTFANINNDTYDEAARSINGKLNSLSDILNQIVIVGGAVQTEDKTGYKSPEWASYGDAIDIAAPAEGLFKESDDDKGFKGTSFAAPMVSGAAAMILANNPKLKASEVKDLLLKSAEDEVKDERKEKTYSYPMLNMMAFLDAHSFYNDLLENYRIAIRDQWKAEKLNEEGLGIVYEHPDSTLFDNYGYEFRDINGNGLPELVLGIYREDGSAEIHEIYTLQNKKPVKLFINGIRTNIKIYEDGTISETYGDRFMGYFKLHKDGTEELKDGYEITNSEEYKSLTDPNEAMTETDIKAMYKKYNEIGITEHSFTPFIAGEEADKVVEKNKKEQKLSNADMENIMRENYSQLEEILLEVSINNLYDKHHEVEDGQKIWKAGVDPNSPFYKDMYELLYPKVKHLVAEEGMESLINIKYTMHWQPPAPISFYGPDYDLEVLAKNSERFKLKQTKEISPHEKGGNYYDLIYFIKYVKEDNEWKFAGAEEQK